MMMTGFGNVMTSIPLILGTIILPGRCSHPNLPYTRTHRINLINQAVRLREARILIAAGAVLPKAQALGLDQGVREDLAVNGG